MRLKFRGLSGARRRAQKQGRQTFPPERFVSNTLPEGHRSVEDKRKSRWGMQGRLSRSRAHIQGMKHPTQGWKQLRWGVISQRTSVLTVYTEPSTVERLIQSRDRNRPTSCSIPPIMNMHTAELPVLPSSRCRLVVLFLKSLLFYLHLFWSQHPVTFYEIHRTYITQTALSCA